MALIVIVFTTWVLSMIRFLISNSAKHYAFCAVLIALLIAHAASAVADTRLTEAIKICAGDTDPKAREACYSAIKSLAEMSSKGDQPNASIAEILKLIKSAQKQMQEALDQPQPNPYDADRPLSISEIDIVRRQIMSCWNPPARAKDVRNMAVEVRVVMNPDGKVREAHVVTTDRFNSDPFYKAIAESARRAVLNPQCQPFKLPPDRYHIWQTMLLNFDPREML